MRIRAVLSGRPFHLRRLRCFAPLPRRVNCVYSPRVTRIVSILLALALSLGPALPSAAAPGGLETANIWCGGDISALTPAQRQSLELAAELTGQPEAPQDHPSECKSCCIGCVAAIPASPVPAALAPGRMDPERRASLREQSGLSRKFDRANGPRAPPAA